MKQYKITVGERTFDVKLLSDPRQAMVQVEVDGRHMDVRVQSAETEPSVATSEAAPPAATMSIPPASTPTGVPAAGSGQITAPLPGIIKSIAVRPGEKVAPNDILLVIEAMKMDNIIRASRGGTVGTILVTEGRQVNYGAPLIEYAD